MRPAFGRRACCDWALKKGRRNRRSHLVIELEPTPNWDELRCGGIPKEGWGIAEIAVTARSRRDRKGET